jgi:hypothetical protein
MSKSSPESGTGVETAQDLGEARRHARLGQRRDRQRRRLEPLSDEDVPVGQLMDDGRSDTGRGRGPRVVCSFARSTASRSVASPGTRTKYASSSTETFQLRSVSPDAIGSARTVRPAQAAIASITCSIVGVIRVDAA